jgi:hypothetical protein
VLTDYRQWSRSGASAAPHETPGKTGGAQCQPNRCMPRQPDLHPTQSLTRFQPGGDA